MDGIRASHTFNNVSSIFGLDSFYIPGICLAVMPKCDNLQICEYLLLHNYQCHTLLIAMF